MDLPKKDRHRFIIYGAGAIGSVFGGMLAGGGHQVDLVGRAAHMQAVASDGLRIEGLLGEHLVREAGAFTGLGELDRLPEPSAVLVCVKSSDTRGAVDDLARSGLVGGRTLVVSLQNGLGNLETVRGAFGERKSFGGRVIFGAEIREPGRVFVSVWADKVLIGGPSGRSWREAGGELAGELTRCGIETALTDDIEAALWAKVLYNAGLNPLSAILEVPYGHLGVEPNARQLLVEIITEAFAVASVEVKLPWRSAEEYLRHFFTRLLPPTEAHHSSMLQDLLRGRETEVDSINGEIIRRAGGRGIPVPVNRVVYGLVRAKEGKGKG
ncbi:MAG: 2-dehydropantoate 2-reductase [bacterium]|nr:MAG: 2-dehydropantoate 2-reductase [bacterium]